MMINEYKINNTTIYHLNTKKFKTNLFGFSFLLPLSKKYLPEFTILAQMWTKYTRSFQTEREFSFKLNELYDSQIFYNFEKKGKALQITFYLHVINEKLLNDHVDLTNQVFNLFKEVVFTRKEINNSILNKEKKIYNETFESKNSNFLYLTNTILYHLMFEHENYLNQLDVNIDEVNKITVESMNEAYDLIIDSPRFGFVIGDFEKEKIFDLFHNIPFNNKEQIDFIDRESKNINKTNIKIIPHELPQSTLMIGYRTNIVVDSKEYYAMCVLNNYLGASYDSLLIKVLREEHNLVYQINSEYDWYKGVMFINCGISYENYEIVMTLIDGCINNVQNGLIDEEIFTATKTQMISNQMDTEDNLISLIETINQKYFYGSSSIDNLSKIEKIKNVTYDDIKQAASTLITDSIVLFGKDR